MRCEIRFRDDDGYEIQCEKEAAFIVDAETSHELLICNPCKSKKKVHKSRIISIEFYVRERAAKVHGCTCDACLNIVRGEMQEAQLAADIAEAHMEDAAQAQLKRSDVDDDDSDYFYADASKIFQ